MFIWLLVALLVAASVHVARMQPRTTQRIGEIFLLYLVVGYCGVPMLALSVWGLLNPDRVAGVLGFPAGNPFPAFLGYAYLGMALLAVLALWYRRAYLVAPAVIWAVFFAGATAIHVQDVGQRGVLTHHSVLAIVASHGLISLLLVSALAMSAVWKERS